MGAGVGGADVAATPGLLGVDCAEAVILLGDEPLCGLYARALATHGAPCERIDGEAAAVAGLFALHSR